MTWDDFEKPHKSVCIALLASVSVSVFILFYLFLAVLGLRCYLDFSLLVVSEGYSLGAVSGIYSLVAMQGLLTAVASLVAEHRLQGSQTPEHRLNSCDT